MQYNREKKAIWVIPVLATVLAVCIVLFSVVAYAPKSPIDTATPPARMSAARQSLLSPEGFAANRLRLALGANSAPLRTIDLIDVTAQASSAMLRPDGNGLILSVTISSITNGTDRTLSFDGANQCGQDTADETVHYMAAVPYTFISMFDTVPGYRWHDGDSYATRYWAYSADTPDENIFAGDDGVGQSGRALYVAVSPYIMKSMDCEVGTSATNSHSLKTSFEVPNLASGQTKQLRTNNVIEFEIPPASEYVSSEVPLSESNYPYMIGGVFLVSSDYSAAAWIDLG
ncbi:MAG: hypothetical protein FWD63_07965 [Propionibacteriaceae bacterium]|nr:hypothetical protein [Propionibacteriaceae bacterium]